MLAKWHRALYFQIVCETSDLMTVLFPNEWTLQAIGENLCRFCGLDGCLLKKQDGGFILHQLAHIIMLRCKIHALINVSIHCHICPSSVSKIPQTIWKYNALFHLANVHSTVSTGTTPPTITGQLLLNEFVSKRKITLQKSKKKSQICVERSIIP